MKLSVPFGQLITAGDLIGKNMEETIEHCLELGIGSMDFSLGSMEARNIPYSYIKNIYKTYGLRCDSTCDVIEFEGKNRDDLKEQSKRFLEKCADLDCPVFMPVPIITKKHETEEARRETLKRVIEYLNDTAELSKKYNVITTVENYSDTNIPVSYISDMAEIFDNAPDVKYVFDVGNFWFGGTDSLEACKKFADRTVYVHLKDLVESPEGWLKISGRCSDSVAIGDGELPVYECINVLKNAGYSGAYQVEINHIEKNLMSDIEKSVANLKANV